MSDAREQQLAMTFVTLTDTLIDVHDPFHLMLTLVEQAVARSTSLPPRSCSPTSPAGGGA